MLVLTRRVGEAIVIGGTIRVTLVVIKGDRVRLGISAPASVPVDRSEVHERRLAALLGTAPLISSESEGEWHMQTAQQGDRVQVHYVKRFQDGSVASSWDRAPVELTVGVDHPRLPGLGLALVGLAPGGSTKVSVPAERAYGTSDPARVHRWARTRFAKGQPLPIGKWVQVPNAQGRRRLIRILEVQGKMVVVDTNHRWAGQSLDLEVELVSIGGPDAGPTPQGP
jgi:carbon storage regulator CsrA